MEEYDDKYKVPVEPSTRMAAISMLLVATIMVLGIGVFDLSDYIHILLIFCIIVLSFVARKLGSNWGSTQDAMVHGLKNAMPAMFFFFIIGMAVAAWIQCGTLPALIYYGLNILTPSLFLVGGLIIVSITSIATGSSWTAEGTIGIVLMGIGKTMGISAPLTAGMIVSGAYFGDKMTPLSDTTNLAPAIAGTDVQRHIKAMMPTAVPAFVTSAILYAIIGSRYAGSSIDYTQVELIQSTIAQSYKINFLTLTPLILTLVLSIMKFPAIPSMMAGIGLAFPISFFLQGASFPDFISVLNDGVVSETGVEMVDSLFTRGGIQEMMWTFSLGFLALILGGLINYTGVMSVLLRKLTQKVQNRRFYPMFCILTGLFGTAVLGEQYMAIVVSGEVWKEPFAEKGYKPQMLSRCMEEGGTVSAVLFPWTTCGAWAYETLGVYNFEFIPFAFFNLLTLLFGILFPLLGKTMVVYTDEELAARKKELEEPSASAGE